MVVGGAIMVMVSRGCLLGSLGAVGREEVGLVVGKGKGKGKGSSNLGLEGGGVMLVVGSEGEEAARGEGIGDVCLPHATIGPVVGD